MRTDHRALAALDAGRRLPHRDLLRQIAFLVLRGGGGEGAVARHGADRQVVAAAGDDLEEDVAHELGRVRRDRCVRSWSTATALTVISCRFASVASIAFRFFCTTASPLRAYVLRTALQMASSASSNGITFAQAKKATCMIVLMRLPMPDSRATRDAHR